MRKKKPGRTKNRYCHAFSRANADRPGPASKAMKRLPKRQKLCLRRRTAFLSDSRIIPSKMKDRDYGYDYRWRDFAAI
jgi:hypothetical protein